MAWIMIWDGTALVYPGQPPMPPAQSTQTHNRLGEPWGGVPTNSTAGLITSEAALTAYNAESTQDVTIPSGAEISSKIIYGKIQFAGSATLRNCLLVGPSNPLLSGNEGVVNCTNTRTGQARLFDCEIRPRTESIGRNCLLGDQYELYGCWLHGGEDGAGIYPRPAGATIADVVVAGCLIEDFAYAYPDRDHSDGSHCDGIQIQGGTNIHIIGNAIWMTGHYMAGSGKFYTANPSSSNGDWTLTKTPPQAPGSGIIIHNSVSAPFNETVIIEKNHIFYGGKMAVQIQSTANNFIFRDNKLSALYPPASNVNGTVHEGTTLAFTYNPYWIRIFNLAASGNINGLTSGGAVSNTTNTWADGGNAGNPLTTPRASGIHIDA